MNSDSIQKYSTKYRNLQIEELLHLDNIRNDLTDNAIIALDQVMAEREDEISLHLKEASLTPSQSKLPKDYQLIIIPLIGVWLAGSLGITLKVGAIFAIILGLLGFNLSKKLLLNLRKKEVFIDTPKLLWFLIPAFIIIYFLSVILLYPIRF